MSVIFKIFIFRQKMKIKNKNIFLFLKEGLTRFDLAPTYLHQGWRIRVT